MLAQKEGLGQETAQKPQKQTYSGLISCSWEETNQELGGYIKMPGESAWSQKSDSAVSMFPMAPGWEDEYLDLTPYCQESQQNTSSKVKDTKSFSCIAPDDELNTPEICIQRFDYPAQANVLSRDDTSPMSLFDDGKGEFPSLITISSRETSINRKIQDIVTSDIMVDHSESNEKHFHTAMSVQSDQLQSEVDEISIPSISHEEEILSTFDAVTENSVDNSIHIYYNGTECVQLIESVKDLNEIIMMEEENLEDSDMESNRELEPLLDNNIKSCTPLHGIDFLKMLQDIPVTEDASGPVKVDVENSVNSDFVFDNQQFVFSNKLDEEPSTSMQTDTEKLANTKVENTKNSTALIPTQNDRKLNKHKKDLNLNLVSMLGIDDMISTPVILETLLGEEVPFTKLLNYIQPTDDLEIENEPAQTTSTVDFSEVSFNLQNKPNNVSVKTEAVDNAPIIKTEAVDNTPTNVMVVRPVVIKKSANGKLSVRQSNVSDEVENEDKKRSGKKPSSKNKFVKTVLKIEENINEIADDEDYEVLIPSKLSSQKRKNSNKETIPHRPRGRPPNGQPSTSKNDGTRQRKISFGSDFSDTDCPPAKRARQTSTESNCDKYRELRDRNNEASRKSRINRKSREADMMITAEKLEKENQSLRIKAEEMERLVKKLRQALLEAVTKGKENS